MISTGSDTSAIIVTTFGIVGFLLCAAFAIDVWVLEPRTKAHLADLEARIIELERGKE